MAEMQMQVNCEGKNRESLVRKADFCASHPSIRVVINQAVKRFFLLNVGTRKILIRRYRKKDGKKGIQKQTPKSRCHATPIYRIGPNGGGPRLDCLSRGEGRINANLNLVHCSNFLGQKTLLSSPSFLPMAFRLLTSRIRSRLHQALSHTSPNLHRPLPLDFSNLQSLPSIPCPLPNLQSPFSHLRRLSTIRRPPTTRSSRVDIGARARQLQNRRLWTYALTFGGIAGFIVIILSNFQDQMVFYITPTDALEKFAANPSKNRFRLGGLVLEGSVVQPASSPDMEFVITDLLTDILVRYRGSLPDLFREGHSVVVEGIVRPFDDDSGRPRGEFFSAGKTVSEKARSASCYFAATEVLAKHDEKYMPKEVAAALERNKAKLEAGDSAAAVEATS
ncbi:hypothetical protein ACLOJK_030215 [Asimina triloba]